MIAWIAAASCLLAVAPALLFLRNLALYSPPRRSSNPERSRCSVLIPARDEEANIALAVRSILQERDVDLELIVLDDGSTDRTAQIVREIAATDERVRLETAPPLPDGWCGKQHACYTLARLARNPLLIFIDADVRLKPGALARISGFMEESGAALASGVPQQETRTFSERLLIPLIQFVLLGFLPIKRMRARRDPSLGAGCGQLFVAQRDAYLACGGHNAIRGTLHDGSKLPRVFRAAGFATDLFDASDIALCRMYSNNRDVWDGLARSAHEGLGSSNLIGPATLLLFGGQVLPFLALVAMSLRAPASSLAFAFFLCAAIAALLPRLIGILRFRQSLLGALLHPLGVCALLAIQWFAFVRARVKRPAVWRGRSYFQPAPSDSSQTTTATRFAAHAAAIHNPDSSNTYVQQN